MEKLFPYKLQAVISCLKISQADIAREIKKTPGYITQLVKGLRQPSEATTTLICKQFPIDEQWLTDETDRRRYSEKEKKFIEVVRKQDGSSTGSILSLILSSETRELLEMTREVIESDTGFAESLKSNIRSFHYSLELKKRLEKAECQGQEVHKGSASDRAANNG